MKKYVLIGYPVGHSFSKKYFEEKFSREQISGCDYELYPISDISKLPELITVIPELCGLNVTIPYKEAVLPYLDVIHQTARAIGAVNCIKIIDGKLYGYNTDVIGFERSLEKFLTVKPWQAFVLGSGGSAKTVKYVLNKMNVPLHQVSRTAGGDNISYAEIEQLLVSSNLFVNTTPLGMFPHIEDYPAIPYSKLSERDFLFDLIYNPAQTEFLKRGRAARAAVKNGLEMLHIQAEESWKIWNE